MAAPQASSRLEMLQARFQQKQLQEKEQKLLQLYDQQQRRAYQVVQRGSAGSNGSNHGSTTGGRTTATTTTHTSTSTSQGGKVRQMFDERRQTTVKGIDRSYPLEPLENKLRKQNTNGVTTQRNGNLTVNRQSVSMRRVARADVNSNVNGGKPVVSYHEEVTRESFGPSVRRHDDEDEFGVENRIATFANGHHHHDIDNEEETLDQEMMDRNRMMAKIHLMGFDETLKHRVRNDLESEEFPEYLMVDVPDKLPKRNVTKKLSQAEARLERFKNANAKRSNMQKQSTVTNTVIKKRSEQMIPARSNSRGNEMAGTARAGSARRGSSWTSERGQRNPENARNSLPAADRLYAVDEMSKRRKKSSDIEILSRRDSPRSSSSGKASLEKAEATSRTHSASNGFKSLTSDGKIFVRRNASPEFFCKENERSATRTTMRIDRKSIGSGSTSSDRQTFTKRSTGPEFFCKEGERSATTMSIDRKSIGSGSTSSDRQTLTKRSASPELFFCGEDERSTTTMSVDRNIDTSESPNWSRDICKKRGTSPLYFDREFKQGASTRLIYEKGSGTKFWLEPDRKTSSRREGASPQFSYRGSERSATVMSTYESATELSDLHEEVFIEPRAASQYLRKESDTTVNVDRKSDSSRSSLFCRETSSKRSANPKFYLNESGITSESVSPIWDRGTSSRRSMSPRYSSYRSKATVDTDRKSTGSKSLECSKEVITMRNTTPRYFDRKYPPRTIPTSLDSKNAPSYERKNILRKRRTSPQFFCKESERSGATVNIDRKAIDETRSSSYDRLAGQSKKSQSLNKRSTEQSSATIVNINRKTREIRSSSYDRQVSRRRRSASPQFFCKETERSGTTALSVDRKASEPRRLSAYGRKILMEQSRKPRSVSRESKQPATTMSAERTRSESKSKATRDKRTSSNSPQFFCGESKKSATTVVMEPRSRSADSGKNILKQTDYVSDASHKRSVRSSSFDKTIALAQKKRTSSSPSTKREVKENLKEERVTTEMRRSSRISEASATSASSIVSLKYGLEFDNILQSAGLVRKFMKSQNRVRRSSAKRDTKNTSSQIAKNNQSRNRQRTCSLFQKESRHSPVENRKRPTPESARKSITPTEVDMEIQEITMTDHRIERDKTVMQKPSRTLPPTSSRSRIDRTYTKRSSSNGRKFKASFTYPVRKTHKQRASILESGVFKDRSKTDSPRRSKGSGDDRGNRDAKGSAISLSRLVHNPTNESSQRLATRSKENEDRRESETKMFAARDQIRYQYKQQDQTLKCTEVGSKEYEYQRRSRSPSQIRGQSTADGTVGSLRTTSLDFPNERSYFRDTAESPILRDLDEERTEPVETRMELDRPQSLRSARLAQGALRDQENARSPARNDECDREKRSRKTNEEYRGGVDGIGRRYRTTVEIASNKGVKDRCEITGLGQVVSLRRHARTSTRKPPPSISKKTRISSARRSCGRQHDVRSGTLPRVSAPSGGKSAKVARSADDTGTKISPCREEFVLSTASAGGMTNVKRKGVGEGSSERSAAAREAPRMRREDDGEDVERMDSVESALRRFDSIGAESEHSVRGSRASPEISLLMMGVQTGTSAKGSTVDASSRQATLTSDATPIGKSLKVEEEVVARKSGLKVLRKEISDSPGRLPLTKTGNSIKSKQGSAQKRSPPMCKRRLFEELSDSKKVIREERRCAKTQKKENYSAVDLTSRKDERKFLKTIRSSESFDREVAKRSKKPEEETPTISVKPLRSIEDIRRSIDNERSKLISKEGGSAIANLRSASRDTRKSIPATDAARHASVDSDPAKSIKIKSCVSRISKSPSPDIAARKQHETNTRATRGSASSSPSKSPDITPRRASAEAKNGNQEAKPSRRSAVAKGTAESIGAADAVDSVVLRNGSLQESSTKRSDAFVIDFDEGPSKESCVDTTTQSKKMIPTARKSSNDKHQTTSSASDRPTSSVSSNSSASATQVQAFSTRGKMGMKAKAPTSGGPQAKGLFSTKNVGNGNVADNLIACKTCGRRFAQDRISLHEQICAKTVNKKRKQFDTVMSRVKGTELESFVKKGITKKQESKAKKPQPKSDWRRKHEDFLMAIRSAKQVQAHLASGGNLRDLPPPPPSDTSDYIQCPHCGRKFNQAAAERHIPKCEHMLHNKPAHARAPRLRR